MQTTLHKLTLLYAVFGMGISPAWAQGSEQLSYPALPDFQLLGHRQQAGVQVQEWVPQGQTLQRWQHRLTIRKQTPGSDIAEFRYHLAAEWAEACPNRWSIVKAESGQTNGHPYELWLVGCGRAHQRSLPDANPRLVWVKAISGQNAFYRVEYAFNNASSARQETGDAAAWMEQVTLTTE